MPPPRREARQQREQRLLEAAREVLRERGFDADIRDILARAGVGTGTAYRHFANKEALVRAVIDEMRIGLETGLAAAGAEPDVRDAIGAAMQVGFRSLARYGQAVVALFAGTQPRDYADAIDCVAIVGLLTELLNRGIAQGLFPADLDVNHSIGAWLGLFNPLALAGPDGEARDPDEVAAATTRFFLAGLQASREPVRS